MIPTELLRAASEKVAADRAVKNVRKQLRAGNLSEAERLARMYGDAGVLKDTPAGIQASSRLFNPLRSAQDLLDDQGSGYVPADNVGKAYDSLDRHIRELEEAGRQVPRRLRRSRSQLSALNQEYEEGWRPVSEKKLTSPRNLLKPKGPVAHLGGAMEGNVVQVIDRRGIAARKMFHRGGMLDNPELRAHNQALHRAMEGDPNIAKLYGAHKGTIGAMQKVEFIPGRQASKEDIGAEWGFLGPYTTNPDAPARKQIRAFEDRALAQGHVVQDIRYNPENTRIRPDGQAVIIDPMSMPAAEYSRRKKIIEPKKRYINDILDLHYPEGLGEGKAEKVLDQVKRLGPGSRQVRKVRGVKGPGGAAELRARLEARKAGLNPTLPGTGLPTPRAPAPSSVAPRPVAPAPSPVAPRPVAPVPGSLATTTAAPNWGRRAAMLGGGLALAGGAALLGHHLLAKKQKEKQPPRKRKAAA